MSNQKNVGIHGMSLYIPRDFVSQASLEEFYSVSPGKYTKGLGQTNMAVLKPEEDVISMALNATEKLLKDYDVDPKSVAHLQVGTETLVDKSKSIKTHLLPLFGHSNILGVDQYNACYGGTAALLSAVNWVESSMYKEGQFAIVVCGDNAVYEAGPARPTGGAGVIAMLIGPDAPVVLDSKSTVSHFAHVWDFFKPRPDSEYPEVDGPLSTDCYVDSLVSCLKQNAEQGESLASADNVIFHAPYGKLVEKSFAQACLWEDIYFQQAQQIQAVAGGGGVSTSSLSLADVESMGSNKVLQKEAVQTYKPIFQQKAVPGMLLSQQCGNMYTGSVYAALCATISNIQPAEKKVKTSVFSYGSGSASSLLKFVTDASDAKVQRIGEKLDIAGTLAARTQISAAEFNERLDKRAAAYKTGAPVQNSAPQNSWKGSYYLKSVDQMGRRKYARAFSTVLRRCIK